MALQTSGTFSSTSDWYHSVFTRSFMELKSMGRLMTRV